MKVKENHAGETGSLIALSFIVMTACNSLNYADRVLISILFPAIKADLNLTDGQLGLLGGLAFAISYSVMGIVMGMWVDRGNRGKIIATAVGVWSLGTAFCGMTMNFIQLVFARATVATGEAGCMPASHSLIAERFNRKKRNAAIGVFTGFGTAGNMIGLAVGGLLVEIVGWRQTFLFFALPGLLLSAIAFFTVKDDSRKRDPEEQIVHLKLRESLSILSKNPIYLNLLFGAAGFMFCVYSIHVWMPSYFERMFDLRPSVVGSLLAVAHGGGAMIGSIGGGFLAQRAISHSRLNGGMLVAGWAFLISIPLAAGFLIASTPAVAFVLALLLSIAGGIPNGPLFSAIQTEVDPKVRGIAAAIAMATGSFVGIGMGPFVVGLASDAFSVWSAEQSLRAALALAAAFWIWPAVNVFVAGRLIKKAGGRHYTIDHDNRI